MLGFWALTAPAPARKVPALSPGGVALSGGFGGFFGTSDATIEDGMTDRDQHPSGNPLADLKARLAAARKREGESEPGQRGRADLSGAGMALRVGIEMAGTLAVGVAIGWGLDRWLGTKPWLLIVFFFIGAAAGVLNVYRAVSNFGLAPGYRRDADRTDDRTEDKG